MKRLAGLAALAAATLALGQTSGLRFIQDEGTAKPTHPNLNFTGAGVTCSDDNANNRTNCSITGGGAVGYQTIQEEGSGLTQQTTLNFIGSNVTCVDNGGSSRTDCTIGGTDLSGEDFVTFSAEANLSAERVLSNGTGTTVDLGTAGQAQVDCNSAGSGAMGCIQLDDDLGGTAASPDVVDVTCSGSCISDAEVDANITVDWTGLQSYPTGCTNQFVRTIGDTLTCASINNGDWSGTALAIGNGGTGQTTATEAFDALAPTTTQGDTIFNNGTDNVRLAKGTANQVYTMNSGATAPEWKSSATLTGATLTNNGQLDLRELAVNGTNVASLIGPSSAAGDTTYSFPDMSAVAASTGYLKYSANGSGVTTIATGEDLFVDVLSPDVTCAVSASYCTIFSYTPAASKFVMLMAEILIESASTTVAPQFRVSSADSGYTGICHWTLYDKATGTTTAPAYVNTAIGTAPADTASTAWPATTLTTVEVRCALAADASPGAILVEWQLETGTSPTQTVRAGSVLRVGKY